MKGIWTWIRTPCRDGQMCMKYFVCACSAVCVWLDVCMFISMCLSKCLWIWINMVLYDTVCVYYIYIYIICVCVCDYMYACKNPCVCLNVCVTMNKYWYINTCMFSRGCNFLFAYTYSTSPYIIQFNIYNYHIMHMYILPGTPQLLSFNFLSPLRKPSTFGFWGQKLSPQKQLILVINPNDGEKSPSYPLVI